MIERNRPLQTLIILMVIIAGLYLASVVWQLGSRFGDIILPFFLAWLLAFTLNPLADIIVRRSRVRRSVAIGLVYVGLLLTLVLAGLLIVPPLATQTIQLGTALPGLVSTFPDLLAGWQQFLDERGVAVRLNSLFTDAALVQRAEALGTALAQNALGLAQGVASTVLNAVIVLILSFYFMLDGERFAKLFVAVLPERWKDDADYLLQSVDRTFGGFMRGLLIQSVVYGVGTGLIMAVAGLPFIVVASVFAGLIMIIPFVGSIVALLPPIILAVASGSWLNAVLVFVALMLLQQLVLNVITPKVMSDNVGIHPLLIFLAVLVGAKEVGIWGAIFGVPIMGVIWSMFVLTLRQRKRRGRTGSSERPTYQPITEERYERA